MFYHELDVGMEFTGGGRTLTDADLSMACMMSADWHPIHADEVYARRHGHRGRVFHGAFGLFITLGMATSLPRFSDEMIGATGVRDWAYRQPLYVGDTVRVKVAIASKRITSDGRRGIVERSLTLLNQDGTLVQHGVAGTMIRIVEQGEQPRKYITDEITGRKTA
jgi:acyl dehydratase